MYMSYTYIYIFTYVCNIRTYRVDVADLYILICTRTYVRMHSSEDVRILYLCLKQFVNGHRRRLYIFQ